MFHGGILGFVALMGTVQSELHGRGQRSLERAAVLVERTARSELGTYQPAAGPFNAWAPLADSTEERKARAGAPANSPLIRSGEMRDAFAHHLEPGKATITNSDPAAKIQELGGGHTPPRPFLGLALYTKTPEIKHILGQDFVAGFARR